jgi:hypothetical protein
MPIAADARAAIARHGRRTPGRIGSRRSVMAILSAFF